MKPVKKFFVYRCKLSLSLALLYVAKLLINKLKTKFNSFFYLRNGFRYEENSQLPLTKFSRKSSTNFVKSFICRQENVTAVRSLRAKIVIVANNKWVKNHQFVQLSHCFSIYWNNYSPQCRWLVVVINLGALRLGKFLLPLATSPLVNNIVMCDFCLNCLSIILYTINTTCI